MSKSEIERIAQLEVVSHGNKKDIDKIQEEISAFYRITANQDALTTTLKSIVADNKEQMADNKAQMKDFSDTLNRVNLNLTNLNNKSDDMRNDLNRFESELKDVKSNHKKFEDKGKFDVLNFFTNDGMKMVLTALVMAYLAYLGLR